MDSVAAQVGPFDIIVDDGGHRMREQRMSLETLFKHVKPGGVYLCEDLHTSYMPAWQDPGERPFTDVAKSLVDELNGWFTHRHSVAEDSWCRNIASLTFYDSVVVIEKSNGPLPRPRVVITSSVTPVTPVTPVTL